MCRCLAAQAPCNRIPCAALSRALSLYCTSCLGFSLCEQQAFALAETEDTGKPIEDSEGDIEDAIEYLRCGVGRQCSFEDEAKRRT